MKTVADPYSRVICIRLEPTYGGNPVRIASYPVDLRMLNGGWYSSDQGNEISDFDQTTGFTPPVIEIKGVASALGISRERLLRGELDGSSLYIFATSWVEPIEDEEPIGRFILGKSDITDSTFTVEAIGIIDAFNLDPNITYSKDCQNTLFDISPNEKPIPFSCCGLDQADYTVTGTITSSDLGPPKTFTDTTRTEADDWFTLGYIQFMVIDGSGSDYLSVIQHYPQLRQYAPRG